MCIAKTESSVLLFILLVSTLYLIFRVLQSVHVSLYIPVASYLSILGAMYGVFFYCI
jgi:hypothetical protein